MRALLLLAAVSVGQVSVAVADDAAALKDEILSTEPYAVLDAHRNGTAQPDWEAILTAVRSGNAAWLEVAVLLYPAMDGPTAVEYAVMMALIIVVCITTVTAIGTKANAQFDKVKTALN